MGYRLKAEGRSYWSFRTPCSAGETPEFEASCSSPARGLKLRPVPPSPRPSPLGRGGNGRQPAGASEIAETLECRARGLPLPAGEGRGEGEGTARGTHPVRIAPQVRYLPEGLDGFEPFIISSLRLCRRSLAGLCPAG